MLCLVVYITPGRDSCHVSTKRESNTVENVTSRWGSVSNEDVCRRAGEENNLGPNDYELTQLI